jgi:hypothetical protein
LSSGFYIANAAYLLGFVCVYFFGSSVLDLFSAQIRLLSGVMLWTILFGFFIETNLAVFISYLVISGRFEFVKIYALSTCFGLMMSLLNVIFFQESHLFFFVWPVAFQLVIALPLIYNLFCADLGVGKSYFFRSGVSY